MEVGNYVLNDLIDYYKNQIFKMLGLFEAKDTNGFKYAIRILSEMSQIPTYFPQLKDDYRFTVVLLKIEVLSEELYFLDGEHRFVKNHVMESLKILDEIKEGEKGERV